MVRGDIPESDRLFLIDMLEKLREPAGYDACCLLVIDYEFGVGSTVLRHDLMDESLGSGRFFKDLVEPVLHRTPVDTHVGVRERREDRELPIEEGRFTEEGSAVDDPEEYAGDKATDVSNRRSSLSE